MSHHKVDSSSLPGSAGRLSGIDVSSNNFGSDSVSKALAAFKKDIQGQKFTFVKASEGTSYKNPYFKSQWADLGKQVASGKMDLRVAYHFLDAGSDSNGVAQAKAFLSEVGVKGKLPAGTRLALDFEGSALKTPGVLKAAADYIHKVTGDWPLVYTSSGSEGLAHEMVPSAPKWEANYGPSYKGLDNKGGAVLPSRSDTFDQYSDGKAYGKSFDLNVFNGSEAALKKFAGDKTTPAHKPAPKDPLTATDRKDNAEITSALEAGPISSGAKGPATEALQHVLSVLGYSTTADKGAFGKSTTSALKDFQASVGLHATGTLDKTTFEKLVSAQTELRANPKDEVAGEKSSRVASLQKDLEKVGYKGVKTTSILDASTESAVKAFQKKEKLSDNGVVDGATLSALDKAVADKNIPHEPTVRSGSSGAAVKKLQTLLTRAGYNTEGIDGKFGPHTQAAVMDYQYTHKLTPTGVVDSKTWKDLLTGVKADRKLPKNSGGTDANQIAQRYLGDSEHYLEFSHRLPMDTWPSTSEDCANFASSCLQVAGKLPSRLHSDNVNGLKGNLLSEGWREIPMSQAKPGDVVCFNGPLGPDQHVELFNAWVDGKPQYIGSNNILSDGSQAISLDDGSYFNGYAKTVLAPPV
jgi:peptidoglycan hydrolase-like protein with peptidoglycan-binding domain/GH25 family lysozyme M1 (1,4-beta-N-acetylmuramidase)